MLFFSETALRAYFLTLPTYLQVKRKELYFAPFIPNNKLIYNNMGPTQVGTSGIVLMAIIVDLGPLNLRENLSF